MAQKQHGTTKNVTPNTKAIKASSARYIKALESGLYDKELSFFDKNTGGYLLYSKNRKMDNMEYNAATFMAAKGKQITMTPEGEEGYELIIANGKQSMAMEGLVSLHTNSVHPRLQMKLQQERLLKTQ